MFTSLASYGVKSTRPIFKIKMLIYQPKANLDEKIFLGKITHHLDQEIRKMLVKVIFGSKDSPFHSGPY